MANITKIKATIYTADTPAAGTDGDVYLGICGREFYLRQPPPINDFERASVRDYLLGRDSNVQDSGNDPRDPQLDTADADQYPIYIRFEPTGKYPDWDFDGAEITISPGNTRYGRFAPANGPHLVLGQTKGKFCYLRRL